MGFFQSKPLCNLDFESARKGIYAENEQIKCRVCNRLLSEHKCLCALTKNELLANQSLYKDGRCTGCNFGIGFHK
jgi:hypothetical protein